MPNILSPDTFDHMALVFAEKNGKAWAPRNQSSRVLLVKGGETEANPTMMERFATTLKGMFIADGATVPDKIDGDGDGAEDYDRIAVLMMNTYYDLSASWQLSGESARTAAVVASIDTFLANLDDVRTGGDGMVAKSGRKHSAGTLAKMSELRTTLKSHYEKVDGIISDEFGVAAKGGELDDDPGEALATGETPESVEAATDAFLVSKETA